MQVDCLFSILPTRIANFMPISQRESYHRPNSIAANKKLTNQFRKRIINQMKL